jgi:hypothetical protein
MAQSQLPAAQQHLNQRFDASPTTREVCAVSLVKLSVFLGDNAAPEPLFRGKGLCFIFADCRQVCQGRVLFNVLLDFLSDYRQCNQVSIIIRWSITSPSASEIDVAVFSMAGPVVSSIRLLCVTRSQGVTRLAGYSCYNRV